MVSSRPVRTLPPSSAARRSTGQTSSRPMTMVCQWYDGFSSSSSNGSHEAWRPREGEHACRSEKQRSRPEGELYSNHQLLKHAQGTCAYEWISTGSGARLCSPWVACRRRRP